jgi:hypothetical protein
MILDLGPPSQHMVVTMKESYNFYSLIQEISNLIISISLEKGDEKSSRWFSTWAHLANMIVTMDESYNFYPLI